SDASLSFGPISVGPALLTGSANQISVTVRTIVNVRENRPEASRARTTMSSNRPSRNSSDQKTDARSAACMGMTRNVTSVSVRHFICARLAVCAHGSGATRCDLDEPGQCDSLQQYGTEDWWLRWMS